MNYYLNTMMQVIILNAFDAGKYVSFEEQINNNKGYYYETLRQSSVNWMENKHSYIPFIESFLSTLYMCYKELDKRFSIVNSNKITKKARIEATAPYGYKKDSENKYHLAIDEQTANVVRLIYEKYLAGFGIMKITNYLIKYL